MQQRHMRAYNFLATYERILNEIGEREILSPNDIDIFLRGLKMERPGRAISEDIPTPRVYRQSKVGCSNLLTRLHHAEWGTTEDISLYNFILANIGLVGVRMEDLDPILLSDIEVPMILMCRPQTHIYHI